MTIDILKYIEVCKRDIEPGQRELERIALINQERVLEAFWRHRVAQTDLAGSTGYGLSDVGRDKFETMFAEVFGAQAGLVRPQIVSGTHAISLAMYGLLRPGDELIYATGMPYDTLHSALGLRPASGSLQEWGVHVNVVDLLPDGGIDVAGVIERCTERTKLVMFQRSRGYSLRRSFTISELADAFARLKAARPKVYIGVDNCYGEFVEAQEPCHVGADLAMGSLIKNPGAGIAPTGGYVVGCADAIEQVAARLVAPGTAAEYGPTGPYLLTMYQALFLAPHIVMQAVKGSRLLARALSGLGYRVTPACDAPRTDLILSIEFGDPTPLLAFCRAIQSAAPIDAHVRPEPDAMAGYADEIVMAAGTFIQGASLELSADAPIRPPYIAYVQGGLTYEHVEIALRRVLDQIVPNLR
ncbi:hypothetical protein Heshes_01650 [Alicyclobacillus hesperidum]|uniref:Cystathionine beta-lyase family protein involved in aluminum resistance n=1 Tax=Alicyclobacillus hesperidum TaxID=89784 RepID=A0A1H2SP25_9BACL|nr:methionine gamma-lyase family protein [Alicyclobacillus hesperidum]GLV12481.1 hypothetical protein Heshes_01650 [Alicyclobacillus hesperidum]SDW33391.1 Cystathionine beta-lyase family protein involved in aluminum resistance [Alicyclobacillus hesperidum]